MKDRDVRDLLTREMDAAQYARIRARWETHSTARDGRDIPGMLSTLTADCLYELVPEQRTWLGHAGATAFYKELFGAFPDIRFELSDIVIGAQGVCVEARVTATHRGTWLGKLATGNPVLFRSVTILPWHAAKEQFTGERIYTDPGVLIRPSRRSQELSFGTFDE